MTEAEGTTTGTAGTAPTCYRHPDRETYLRCSRCDRPVCPDCMRAAPVGQHCLQCIADARAATPAARTVLGGRVSRRVGTVTRILIAVNVVAFVLQGLVPGFTSRFEMLPGPVGAIVGGHVDVVGVAAGEYYRLLTGAFLHGGLLHIALNMLALYFIGTQVEAVVGTVRYLALYLLSALGGSVLSYLIAAPGQASVGASGAIFGVFGALFVVARRLNLETGGIVFVLGLNLVFTFLNPAIDWRAHVGGLVTGTLLAAVLAYAPPRLRPAAAVGASAGLAVVLVVLVVVRTAALTAA